MSTIKTFIVVLLTISITQSEFLPAYKCVKVTEDQCRFSDLNLTRTRPHFKPVFDDSLPSAIKTITFQTSKIPLWTGDICNYFPSLDKITAEKLSIEEIAEDAFVNCTKLTNLDMAFNSIKSLHIGTFKPLKNLTTLYIYNNNLTEFPPELVQGLNKLEKLAIISNQIKEIDEVRLQSYLVSLKSLWLNDNDFRCDRVHSIRTSLQKAKVNAYAYIATPRVRPYEIRKVDDIICLSDAQWLSEITKPIDQCLKQNSAVELKTNIFQSDTQDQLQKANLQFEFLQNKIDQQNVNTDKLAIKLEEISIRTTDQLNLIRTELSAIKEQSTESSSSVDATEHDQHTELELRINVLEEMFTNLSETISQRMTEALENSKADLQMSLDNLKELVKLEMSKVENDFYLNVPQNLEAKKDESTGHPIETGETILIAGVTSFVLFIIMFTVCMFWQRENLISLLSRDVDT